MEILPLYKVYWKPQQAFNQKLIQNAVKSVEQDTVQISVTSQMKARLRQLQQSRENLTSGMTFLNVTNGYLAEMQDITERLKVLAIKATSGTANATDRQLLQVTVSSLIDELDRVAKHSTYKNMHLFLGDYARSSKTASMWFCIGISPGADHRIYIATMTSHALSLSENAAKISISTATSATLAIGVVDDALERIKKQRADISGDTEKFKFAMDGLNREIEALTNGIEAVEGQQKSLRKYLK